MNPKEGMNPPSNLRIDLMPLSIPSTWTVLKNEFYDIADANQLSELDHLVCLFGLEDMLMLQRGAYCLDLGWYGAEMSDPGAGYRLCLFRGQWYNGDLMERFSSKDRHVIAEGIQCFIRQVDEGAYDQAMPIPWVKDQIDGSALQ